MKLGIKRVRRVSAINIEGKPLLYKEKFYIYKSYFFGLIKVYVTFSLDAQSILEEKKVYISYRLRCGASWFRIESNAQAILNDMRSNPDKYIFVYEQ